MTPSPPTPTLPVRTLTRLLADLQTTIVSGGMSCFSGELERFVIFSLIINATLCGADRDGAISIHSVALSLNRPFETVRRHAMALVDGGYCLRTKSGLSVPPPALTRPDIETLFNLTHDAFVRFVADCAAFDAMEMPSVVPGRRFTPIDGVIAAVTLMLDTIERNRPIYKDTVDLVLFSTILHANALNYEEDRSVFPHVETPPDTFAPAHAVRLNALSRTLNIPETTVRRRLVNITGPGRPIARTPRGLVVSLAWMNTPQAIDVGRQNYAAIHRVFARAATAGLPFDRPTSAYLGGRPPTIRIV